MAALRRAPVTKLTHKNSQPQLRKSKSKKRTAREIVVDMEMTQNSDLDDTQPVEFVQSRS